MEWAGPMLIFLVVIVTISSLLKNYFIYGGSRTKTRVVYRDHPSSPEAEPPNGSQQLTKSWKLALAARDEFVKAHTEYEVGERALYEQLFNRPLLKDTSEPLTAAWLDAKEDFDAHFPDAQPSTAAAAEEALKLARATRDAWRAADKNARCIGIGELSDSDAARLDQAQRLLTSARDRATTAEERRSQVLKISQILGDLTHRPAVEVTKQIEQSLNPWLRSIGSPELRLAIES